MMNVYEALNDGISVEELTQVFNKEIAAAQEQIKQEKLAEEAKAANAAKELAAERLKAELTEDLEDAREDLAIDIAYYIDTLINYINGKIIIDPEQMPSMDPDDIIKMLKEFEQGLIVPKSTETKGKHDKDAEAIAKFLKLLL